MTGMRPAACSTAMRISSPCSSTSTVGDSPVVPTATIARRALVDVPVDQPPIAVEVEAAVFVHRRDDRDDASLDHGRSLAKPAFYPTAGARPRTPAGRAEPLHDGGLGSDQSRARSRARRARRARPRRRVPPPTAGRPDSTACRSARCPARRSRRSAARRVPAARPAAPAAAETGSWRPPPRRSAPRIERPGLRLEIGDAHRHAGIDASAGASRSVAIRRARRAPSRDIAPRTGGKVEHPGVAPVGRPSA